MNGVAASLSLCMIVRNEAENLARCLQSTAGVADEIILVDTGSTDGSVALATAHGAKVFSHPWQNDFSRARNAGLEQATGEWILHLDADEELEAGSAARLRPLLERTTADAVLMVQRSLTPSGALVRYSDLRVTRLFRNRPAYRYEQAIHEQIRPAIERRGGRVVESDLLIWHYGYAQSTAQGRQHRARRNLELLEHALAGAPDDAYLHYQIGATHKSLNHPGRAERHLRRALAGDQDALGGDARDLVYMKLAQLALASHRAGDALAYARSSLALNPTNTISLYVAALALLERGDLPGAHACFGRLRDRPDLGPERRQEIEAVLTHLASRLARS